MDQSEQIRAEHLFPETVPICRIAILRCLFRTSEELLTGSMHICKTDHMIHYRIFGRRTILPHNIVTNGLYAQNASLLK